MNEKQVNQPELDPNNLVDGVRDHLRAKNDAALSRILKVDPPVISKIRHKRLPVGASILIKMHEASDLSIETLRSLLAGKAITKA